MVGRVMKKFLIFFLFLFSNVIFADTLSPAPLYWSVSGWFPANTSSIAACTAYGQITWPSTNSTYTWTTSGYSNLGNNLYSQNCLRNGANVYTMYSSAVCPTGSTITSQNTCLNATACSTGTTRNYSGYCSKTCEYPESDNGFGACAVMPCPAGQVKNTLSNVCQTPPVCTGSQTYINITNLCLLSCPPNSHPASAAYAGGSPNNCLPNPPLTCPAGQTDNGSYTCISDTPVACPSGTYSGLINNIPQCIPSLNAAQAINDSGAAQTAQAAAQTAANTAASNLAASNTAANIAANTAAQNALASANQLANEKGQAATTAILAGLNSTTGGSSGFNSNAPDYSATLNAIKANGDLVNQQTAAKTASQGGTGSNACSSPPTCSGDAVQCAIMLQNFKLSCQGDDITQASTDSLLGTPVSFQNTTSLDVSNGLNMTGLGLARSCPIPTTYSVMGKSISIDLSPFCSIASIMSNLILVTAAFVSIRVLASSNT